ncbi:glycosyltransferase family 32 protein [Prosthecobacter fluviatilis]|uniref:Glycosyltransferase family 32 protein n=2 Tax=Prosthecobacter fluviatilis TaxID=445931 RepID=A0ABW0KXS0_9BACT
MNMIPKIVHQTWKDDNITYWVFQRSQASVRAFLGHWEYKLWTDADLERLMKADFPQFYEAWSALDRHIKRVDTARYCMLYKYGGIYADLDFVFTRPVDEIITGEADMYFYKSTEAVVKKQHFLGNAFMVSKPLQPFWLDVLKHMFALPSGLNPLHHTGPRALGEYYEALTEKPNIFVFDGDYFDNEKCNAGTGRHQYGYHVRAATWQHPHSHPATARPAQRHPL